MNSLSRARLLRAALLLALAATFLFTASRPVRNAAAGMDKIDPALLDGSSADTAEFLVILTQQADLSHVADPATNASRGQFVFYTLRETATAAQKPLLAFLTRRGVRFQSFWIANMVLVRGDRDLIQTLATRSDVQFIAANSPIAFALPSPIEMDAAAQGIEWNINQINAPAVWAAGYKGQGVVIGGADTGYEWDHPALMNSYRGWSGTGVDHSYSWHDAIHSGGGICGADSPEPCDDWSSSHGTHTMGTMVGDDGGANQIGVAPGARWIGCRNMNVGVGTPASYSECMQWFVAPTDANNENPDPNRAPHVINNSWICPPAEGCGDPLILETIVNNVRAAGIVVIASAGNSGSGCSSITAPPAIYDSSLTVGSTNSADLIAGSSSRGPVTVDSSGRLKPDVTAPGVNIRSAVRDGGYSTLSGTSMAGPHAAGLAALLISANPTLAGDVDAIDAIIRESALARTTTQICGGVPGSVVPNNTYGFGRIDGYAALQQIPHNMTVTKRAAARRAPPGSTMTYTLTITHQHPLDGVTGVLLEDTLPAGTTFVTATLPHTFDGTTVIWPVGALNNVSTERTLTVTMPATTPLIVRNESYAVVSDSTPPQSGPPVIVLVGFDYDIFVPFAT